MAKSIEVELKFEVLNKSELSSFLKNLELKSKKRVKDLYLDTLDGELFKKGIFIRLRNGSSLDFKFNLAEVQKEISDQPFDHSHCDEYTFSVPLKDDVLNELNEVASLLGMKTLKKAELPTFKKLNNLIESVKVDRKRSIYKAGQFDIVIDEVDNLGNYLEIEYMTSDNSNLEKVKNDMRDYLKNLQLKYINTGYNELYWRKNNFPLYLQGKYLLDEDFVKFRKNS
jgi:adenylate cyclase class IV